MTLWAMAKSPLMYGGDVRKLDDVTFSLITHPTLLEINHFTWNNTEFPYVTAIENFKSENGIFSWSSKRHVSDHKTSGSHVLGLISCSDARAIGWSSEARKENDYDKICWRENLGSKHQNPFCLHKRASRPIFDEDVIQKQEYQEKLHLFAADQTDLCLHASPKEKVTSKDVKKNSFSPCTKDTNQMWELNHNKTLTNSYSGLCATMNSYADKANLGGVRSWIAKGRKGEIYVALFNLNPVKTIMSAKISDLAKVLPGVNLKEDSCKYREVWSGEDFGIAKQSVSVAVDAHATALFVLNCAASP